jgi:hypothetical protein
MTIRSEPKADPGIGRESAPIGSEAWAQRIRLSMQSLVNQMDAVTFEPKSLKRYVDIVLQHRAWTLLNKPDGTYFTDWEEFFAFRQPWGLGKPWAAIRPIIEVIVGKQTVELATVSEDGRSTNGANQHTGPSEDSSHRDTNPKDVGAKLKAKRLRAILRAPEVVQDAYRAGLIGQLAAAKLGPKDPEPEGAARIVEIARAIAPKVDAAKGLKPIEKRRVQREVNKTVREMLGVTPKVKASTKAASPAGVEEPNLGTTTRADFAELNLSPSNEPLAASESAAGITNDSNVRSSRERQESPWSFPRAQLMGLPGALDELPTECLRATIERAQEILETRMKAGLE